MELLRYLVFFLLPFSFGFPNRNSEDESERYLEPSEFSVLPTTEQVADFGCSKNEHFSFCSAHCQHNCSTLALPIPCPIGCFSGCVCDTGYVRGLKNDCVLIEECNSNEEEEDFDVDDLVKSTSFECLENEKYSFCNAHCQNNCTTLINPVPCSDECISGCVCNEGYVRDGNGECISIEQCTLLEEELTEEEEEDEDFCPPKEFFSPCLAHCQRNCSNWSDPSAVCLKICVPGCICDNGLVRGPYGNCIQPRKCPTRHTLQSVSGTIAMDCPVDEHFEGCKAHCQKNCSNWDQETKCSKICVSGCVCDEGFVRGPYGKCVLTEKCSSLNQKPKNNIKNKNLNSCPEGEERSNLQSIQDSSLYCVSDNGDIKFCPPTYLNGCVCKKGHIRKHDSQCIYHRFLPNANEIHFMHDLRSIEPPLSYFQLEINKESFDFIKSTEDYNFDSTTPRPIIQSLEIKTQSRANDEISTTISQEMLAENLNADFHGCPSQQKCLEWCQKEGFSIGICRGFGSRKYCACRHG